MALQIASPKKPGCHVQAVLKNALSRDELNCFTMKLLQNPTITMAKLFMNWVLNAEDCNSVSKTKLFALQREKHDTTINGVESEQNWKSRPLCSV